MAGNSATGSTSAAGAGTCFTKATSNGRRSCLWLSRLFRWRLLPCVFSWWINLLLSTCYKSRWRTINDTHRQGGRQRWRRWRWQCQRQLLRLFMKLLLAWLMKRTFVFILLLLLHDEQNKPSRFLFLRIDRIADDISERSTFDWFQAEQAIKEWQWIICKNDIHTGTGLVQDMDSLVFSCYILSEGRRQLFVTKTFDWSMCSTSSGAPTKENVTRRNFEIMLYPTNAFLQSPLKRGVPPKKGILYLHSSTKNTLLRLTT